MGKRNYNLDAEMLLKDTGLVAASAAAQIGGVNQILDVGPGRLEGVVVIDVTAVEIASTDEEYQVILQGSNSATFASGIQNLARLDFGSTVVRDGGAIDSLVGRYEMFFCNEQNDVTYRYLRLYSFIAGSIATGLNFTAGIAVLP